MFFKQLGFISPGLPAAVLWHRVLRHALHLLLRGAIAARRLTSGFTRAGKTKTRRIEPKRHNGRQIQRASLRYHVLRFLEVPEGRCGVGSPFAIHADGAVSPRL